MNAYSFCTKFYRLRCLYTYPISICICIVILEWDGANPINYAGFENFCVLLKMLNFISEKYHCLYSRSCTTYNCMCIGFGHNIKQKIIARNFFVLYLFSRKRFSCSSCSSLNFMFSPVRGPINNMLNAITGLPEKLPGWGAQGLGYDYRYFVFGVEKYGVLHGYLSCRFARY